MWRGRLLSNLVTTTGTIRCKLSNDLGTLVPLTLTSLLTGRPTDFRRTIFRFADTLYLLLGFERGTLFLSNQVCLHRGSRLPQS